MKKRDLYIIAFCISLLFFSIGYVSELCKSDYYAPDLTPSTIPAFEDIEMYSYLSSHINEKSTLPEIVDEFEAMCNIDYKAYYDTYRIEADTYEHNGEKVFILTLSYQFEVNWYHEIVDIGIDIYYQLDEDLSESDFVRFFDGDLKGCLKFLREGEIFKVLTDKEIIDCKVFGMLW